MSVDERLLGRFIMTRECNGVCENGVSVYIRGLGQYTNEFKLHVEAYDALFGKIYENDVQLGNISEYGFSVPSPGGDRCRPIWVQAYVYKETGNDIQPIVVYGAARQFAVTCPEVKKISIDRRAHLILFDPTSMNMFNIPVDPGTANLPTDAGYFIVDEQGNVYDVGGGVWRRAKAVAVDFEYVFYDWDRAAAWAIGLILQYAPRSLHGPFIEAYLNHEDQKLLDVGIPFALKHIMYANARVVYRGYVVEAPGPETVRIRVKFTAYIRIGSILDDIGGFVKNALLGCVVGGAAAYAVGAAALGAAGLGLIALGCAAFGAVSALVRPFDIDKDTAKIVAEIEEGKRRVDEATQRAIEAAQYLKEKYNISDEDYKVLETRIIEIRDACNNTLDKVKDDIHRLSWKYKWKYVLYGVAGGLVLGLLLRR